MHSLIGLGQMSFGTDPPLPALPDAATVATQADLTQLKKDVKTQTLMYVGAGVVLALLIDKLLLDK